MPSKPSTHSSEVSPVVGPPRLTRKRRLNHHYPVKQHRKALSTLLKESYNRCVYSLQHVDEIGGRMSMEVDHFNPKMTGLRRNWHGNLMASARLCNNTKRDHWPSPQQIKKGIRYLNPYLELDYGVHIYENRSTGEIHGVTPAGKWHIIRLGLNAEHLINARKRRTNLVMKFTEAAILSGADPSNQAIQVILGKFTEVQKVVLATAIPELPDKANWPRKPPSI